MMMPVANTRRVVDVADPRLADYRALTDVELRRRTEPLNGVFIAEGELVIRRALAAGYDMRSALMSPRFAEVSEALLADVDAPLYVGSEELLESVTGFHVHRGALAVMSRKPLPSVDELVNNAARVIVLEDVNSHTNIGAIFRCAAGLGMDAVLLSPRCADPLYRRSVRVSMGQVFAIRYARFTHWPEGLDALTGAGFELLALTPSEDATPIDTITVSRDANVALILGAEGPGLSGPVLKSTRAVRIPMSGGVDSLNVAAAAAVACFALGRTAS
jgi:tRNA G18 (ribose-2'-O)-methylase SpoU